MDIGDLRHAYLAVEQAEANIDVLVAFAIPGDRRSAFAAKGSDGAGRRFIGSKCFGFADDKRIARDADESAVHAVILPALDAMAEIGVVKRAGT